MANELLEKRREQMFPRLSAAQVERLRAHGQLLQTHAGDVLVESGERPRQFFVVVEGSADVLLGAAEAPESMYRLSPGDFTGEISTLRGSASIARIQVVDPGQVIAIEVSHLRTIVQTDAELSELFMRAFILRRMALVSSARSEVLLLGSAHSADTLRLREFLTRNICPYLSIDVDADPDVQTLFERFHVGPHDIPVVVCRGERVLKNPSNQAVAECLGMNPQVDDSVVHDLLIIGAGPTGLAAAVYGASEGLDVRVLEVSAPGGQAGTSSKIENYLGFPTGISGGALAGRALTQAQKFGANLTVAVQAVKLHCETRPYTVELSDGQSVRASLILIASGARYRTLELADLPRFVGIGVHYAATYLEAQLCSGEEIIIVGGGNSAGQAAVFLASTCRHVHIMVRSGGLSDTMSRYLIRRIEDNPNITLHTHTQLTGLQGSEWLERVSWRRLGDSEDQQQPIHHVFLMTGAVPNTQWLQGCVALDDHGFVKTGAELRPQDLSAARWPLPRDPYLFETSLPGVFATGDVRSGSVKRIASAVGEGSISVQLMHKTLAELSVPVQQRAVAAG